MEIETILASLDHYIDPKTGALVPPVQPSTTFARDEYNQPIDGKRLYGRDQNVTVELAEKILAKIEGAAQTLLYPSGQAAAMALLQALKPNATIIISRHMYWALYTWVSDFCATWQLNLRIIDLYDSTQALSCIDKSCDLVLLEVPSNPMLYVADLPLLAQHCRKVGAKLAVDATAATPYLLHPLALGANIVVHSATKAIGGHADLLGGILSAQNINDTYWQRIVSLRAGMGSVSSAFDAWLLLRGLRTLALRIEHMSQSAQTLTQRAITHKNVIEVLYPGYGENQNQAARAAELMPKGRGCLFSLRIKGGAQAALGVIRRLKLFTRATSLGSCESLVELRKPIEGPDSPVPDDLLRFSVGIENVEDLWNDLNRALSL